jgi:hypothetical protein
MNDVKFMRLISYDEKKLFIVKLVWETSVRLRELQHLELYAIRYSWCVQFQSSEAFQVRTSIHSRWHVFQFKKYRSV